MKLPDWLKLLKGDLDTDISEDVTVLLHEPIGFDAWSGEGISSKMFGAALASIPRSKKITLDINCLGGRIDQGTAMYNMIRARGGVTTRVSGFAASMASVVLQAGEKRQMMPGTVVIVHNPQCPPETNDEKGLESALGFAKTLKAGLIDIMSERTSTGKRELSDMMDKVTMLDPEEAKAKGFCDEIVDGPPAWNDLSPKDFLKTYRSIQETNGKIDLGGSPAVSSKTKHMKLIIASLAGLVTLPADVTDEAGAPLVKTAVDSLIASRDSLKAENDKHINALNLRVTNRVNKAITDKLVTPARKDALIEAGIANEAALDFLDDLVQPQAAAPRRGAPPAPVGAQNGAVTVESLRAEMSEKKGNGAEVARIAIQLRELRGHKELFTS